MEENKKAIEKKLEENKKQMIVKINETLRAMTIASNKQKRWLDFVTKHLKIETKIAEVIRKDSLNELRNLFEAKLDKADKDAINLQEKLGKF